MKQLKVTRAKDRVVMQQKVFEILSRVEGAELSRNTLDRETSVAFRDPRGLAVGVSFDGDDRLDREGTFCMAWHIGGRFEGDVYKTPDEKISAAFGVAMCASVNPYHHHKCTAFGYGFDDLCLKLECAVELLNNGRAYV